jgi:hypothetical protein
MPHLNNSISEKTHQWSAVSNVFTGNARVFKLLKDGGYTHVEFVTESGAVLHKAAVPGAEATLGTYATRANNMSREGCTWSEAKAPRKVIGPTGAGNRKAQVAKIWAADGAVCIGLGEAVASIDSELNVSVAAVRYTEAEAAGLALRKAQAFVKAVVVDKNGAWLGQNFEAETWAVIEADGFEARVAVPAGAGVEQAQIALLPEVAKANKYGLLSEAKIVHEGLNDVAGWVAAVHAKAEAHD